MIGTIIVNQQIGHNEYKIRRLKEEFLKLNVSLEVVINNGTIAGINNNKIFVNLNHTDFILYLDKDIYLARLLEKAGYRLFNKPDFIKMCDDKMLTYIACSNNNISMPETISGPLVYLGNNNPDTSFLKIIAKKLGFPLIIKRVYGSLGEGVYLVKNHIELEDVYKKIANSPLVFQKYIYYKKGQSVRVLIIDGKVFGSFVRYNKNDFRSNFGESADGKELENYEKYHLFAQNIANKFSIEYAGIDLLEGENGEPILCEINSNAFFEEFERVTCLNVARAIAEMVIRKVYKNEQK